MNRKSPRQVSEISPFKHDKTYSDEEIASFRRTEQSEREKKLSLQLFEQAKVPKRNAKPPLLVGDRWMETKNGLIAKLSTGFLFCLCGNRSTGKTQIGVELIRKTVYMGQRAAYITATEFLLEVKATYKPECRRAEADVIASYRKPQLLVIDEFSKRRGTDWEFTLFFELLNRRYGDMTDSLLICNNGPADLRGVLGDSLLARMNETGGVIECGWPGFRG